MLINLLTDTATLVEYKVLSSKAKSICKTFNLRNVKEILSIPVKTIDSYDRLTRQPMTELCRIHEIFSEGIEIVDCSWIPEANSKPTEAESGRLKRGFQFHSIPTEDALTDLKVIATKMDSAIAPVVIHELYKMFGNIYLLGADVIGRKSRLRNLSTGNPELNAAMRLSAKDILEYSRDHIFFGTFFEQYLDKAINRLENWRLAKDALDLYYSLDKFDKQKIKVIYDKTVLDLPKNMQRMGKSFSSIESVIENAYQTTMYSYSFIGMTATEQKKYMRFLQTFKDVYERAIQEIKYNRVPEKSEKDEMSLSYPYLTKEEVKLFVNPLNDNQPEVPAMFRYVKTLLRSNDRNVLIRREMAGLNFENKEKSRTEIAEMVGLTEATVKMILDKPLTCKFDKDFQEKLYSELDLKFGESRVISSKNPVWEQILTEFKLNISIRQLMLVMVTIYRNSDIFTSITGTDYLFRIGPSRRFPMMSLVRQFDSLVNSKRKEQRIIDFHDKIKSYTPEYINPISIVFEEVAEGKENVRQEGPLRFILEPTSPNISVELEAIIVAAGEPIRLEEVHRRYIEKFPDEDVSIMTVQGYLSKNENISFKGLSRYYFLKGIEGQYTGTITDLLIQTLIDSGTPIHIDELTAAAKIHFPKTNRKSVAVLLSRQIPERVTEVSHHVYQFSGQ